MMIRAISVTSRCNRLAIAILAVGSMLNFTPLRAVAQSAKAVPDIQFDERSKDLGTIQEGLQLEFTFTIRNDGQAPLNLTSVKGSCGCTNVRAEKMILAPGERTRLLGVFNSQGRTGKQSKNIVIVSDDPDEPTIALRFNVNVFSELMFTPREISFGLAPDSQPVIRTLRLQARTDPPLEVTEFAIEDNEYISVRMIESSDEAAAEPGESAARQRNYTFEVTLAPGAPMGRIGGRLEIHTSHEKYKLIVKQMYGNVRGDILLSPSVLSFGRVSPGATAAGTLHLTSSSRSNFKVIGVEVGELPITWRVENKASGPIHKVVFELIAPTDAGNRLQGKIQIKTDSPRQPSIDCGVIALIHKPPAKQVDR